MQDPEAILHQLITSFVQPTEQEWKTLKSQINEIVFEKNQVLVSPLQERPSLYLVTDGILRHYTTGINGEEITTWFNEPGSLATDFAAFTTGTPVLFTIEAITRGHAYRIMPATMESLYNSGKIWERLGRLINQYYLIQLINRNNSIHKKTATVRYQELRELSPHLFKTVPYTYLASYLGITLETFSRLKANKY